jgi:hypothetical protein
MNQFQFTVPPLIKASSQSRVEKSFASIAFLAALASVRFLIALVSLKMVLNQEIFAL